MTDHDNIFTMLTQQKEILSKQSIKIDKIEKSLVNISVQEKDIYYMNVQINALWRKYDQLVGPDGTIATLQKCAASCPRETVEERFETVDENIKTNLARQWVAIGAIIALMAAIKLFG